jgi:hypothetical protein
MSVDLPLPEGPQTHHHLALRDLVVAVGEHLELAVPLAHVLMSIMAWCEVPSE